MFKKLILPLALLGVIAISIYAYQQYHRGLKDLKNTRPAFTVTASEIVSEFEANEKIQIKNI